MIDLVIDLRDGGDWSLDLLYAGLIKNLGPQHVLCSPQKVKHTEWEDAEVRDWGLERRTLGYTPYNKLVPKSDSQEGLVRSLFAAGMIRRIWIDERMESFNYLRKEFGEWYSDVPVVVVAGHDRFWNQSPSFVASLYGKGLEAMLLDNWRPEYANLPFRTRRIGWSCNFDHYWQRPVDPPAKDIDISFVGYNSHPDRARFIDHIQREWPDLKLHLVLEREPNSFGQFVSKAEMFDIMQRSKICLNLRGAADRGKTLRAYEIPYVGSYMLSQKIEDPGMAEDFTDGVHCDYFGNEEELDDLIAYRGFCDQGIEFREFIAKTGHEHAINKLSAKQRWADVLDWLEKK